MHATATADSHEEVRPATPAEDTSLTSSSAPMPTSPTSAHATGKAARNVQTWNVTSIDAKKKKKKGTLGVGNGALFFASESDKARSTLPSARLTPADAGAAIPALKLRLALDREVEAPARQLRSRCRAALLPRVQGDARGDCGQARIGPSRRGRACRSQRSAAVGQLDERKAPARTDRRVPAPADASHRIDFGTRSRPLAVASAGRCAQCCINGGPCDGAVRL